MKKHIVFYLSFLFLASVAVQAQTSATVLYESKVETIKVPAVIVEQTTKDFPGFTVDETLLVPSKLYEQRWVQVQKNDMVGPLDYYEVQLKGKNMHSVAAYTPEGKLLNSREVLKNVVVPSAVSATLLKQYPGWTDRRDKEVIKNGKKEVTHYIMHLKKGWKEERVVLDPQGNIVHRFVI
jgi:hypothetical protein